MNLDLLIALLLIALLVVQLMHLRYAYKEWKKNA